MGRPATPAKNTIRAFCLCLCLCLPLITGAAELDQKVALSDIVVTIDQKKVLVFTTIKNAFNEKMETAVKNGIPATFSFLVILENPRKMWFNKIIAEKDETHTLTYDPLKGKYSVTRSWEDNKPFVTDSFEEACDRMCRIEGLRLTRAKKLKKGVSYLVKAKAELDKIELPLYLHQVLFFVSCWDVETDWQTVSFTP